MNNSPNGQHWFRAAFPANLIHNFSTACSHPDQQAKGRLIEK
jgi:hypothetical protein